MRFLSNILYDFNEIYFENISGVRLDSLLEFINIDNKDFNIIDNYTKFIAAVGHCIFSYDTNNETNQ